MSLTLRCRGPHGQATFSGLDLATPISEFRTLLAEKTGVPAGSLEVLSGFPPKLLEFPSTGSIASLGLLNGDTLTVRQGAAPPPASPPTQAGVQGQDTQLGGSGSLADDDEMLARAMAASMEDLEAPTSSQPPSGTPQPSAGQLAMAAQTGPPRRGSQNPLVSNGQQGTAPLWVAVPGGEGACVARRVVESDNSCLFTAVGYVMEHSRGRASNLRNVIAQAVAADPMTYNAGFLGKENSEYCGWIQDPSKWGGGIELSILSAYYGREIAAFDIRTKRCDLYGEDMGYPERVLLIYDGLHYDAMAMAAFPEAPEELDVTIFEPRSRDGPRIMAAAEHLVAATHAARQFTDTANFTLRCGICQLGLKGEKEAVEHAKTTGHTNFAEY